MKKIVSILTAALMAATVFVIPTSAFAYESSSQPSGETGIEQNTNINDPNISVEIPAENYVYTGNEIKPVPIIRYNGTELIEGNDYIVSYENNINAGKAAVKINGKGAFYGERTFEFDIVPVNISKALITFKYTNYDYTGKNIKPQLTVKYKNRVLQENIDYVLESRSIYPGTGTVKIKGINNFGSSVSKKFYIAKVSGFKVKSTGTTSIQLTWTKEPSVTGYKIYRYSVASKNWKLIKTVVGRNTITYTNKNLSPGYGYQYKIRSYVKKGTSKYYMGVLSNTLSTPTRPNKVTMTSLTTNVKLELNAKWKKQQSTGYQVIVSRSPKFTNSIKYTVKSANTLSKKITDRRDNSTYYVKVRAYRKYGNRTLYGKWGNYKKVRTDGTGWATFSGRKYYYRSGSPVKGTQTINKNKYYFSTGSGELLGASYKMWQKVKNQSSGTKWLIATSRDMNVTCVYQRVGGKWATKYYWKCATGAAGTRTPGGTFTVPKTKTHLRYFGEGLGYTCWYATRFYKSCYFHSVLYYPNSQVNILDGRLGQSLSHGCVRLAKNNALWIYNNIGAGTKVIVY